MHEFIFWYLLINRCNMTSSSQGMLLLNLVTLGPASAKSMLGCKGQKIRLSEITQRNIYLLHIPRSLWQGRWSSWSTDPMMSGSAALGLSYKVASGWLINPSLDLADLEQRSWKVGVGLNPSSVYLACPLPLWAWNCFPERQGYPLVAGYPGNRRGTGKGPARARCRGSTNTLSVLCSLWHIHQACQAVMCMAWGTEVLNISSERQLRDFGIFTRCTSLMKWDNTTGPGAQPRLWAS